jgi:hypothetical protein
VRCRAYQLPREIYDELEPQILEQLRDGDLLQLRHLVGEHDLEIEMLSGEWRVLMRELEDYYQVIDLKTRLARMVVSPAELSDFVRALRDPDRRGRWRSISFGIAELADALPADTDLVGLVMLEESDDWLWAEPVSEIVAWRPEVFALLEPHIRSLMDIEDYRALARLAEDHAEGCVEFSPEQWRVLMRHSQERVPELLSVYETKLSLPVDYTHVREALSLVADPRFQPSLDAWLRVHAAGAQYALYFRDASLERREFEGSGLIRLPNTRTTQKMTRVPPPNEIPPMPTAAPIEIEPYEGGQTVPMKIAERDRAAINTDPRTGQPPTDE